MDIGEFFQLSSGKWFSHRTSHQLVGHDSAGGKSTVQIETLPNTTSEVISLCQKHNVNPEAAVCGVRITWNGTLDGSTDQATGTSFLVPIADLHTPGAGTILRSQSNPDISRDRYIMGTDDVLTLITESDTAASEERIWFASPNLRLRTGIIRQGSDYSVASFCSEIRMGVTQTAN